MWFEYISIPVIHIKINTHHHQQKDQTMMMNKNMSSCYVFLPWPLIYHKVRTLFKKLSSFSKNRPPHCSLRQTFSSVSNLIPFEKSREKAEHKEESKNCNEDSHWQGWKQVSSNWVGNKLAQVLIYISTLR